MKIQADCVVRFHYALSDGDGKAIESSEGRDPISALIGHNNIIPGLEEALMDQEAGAKLEVDVPPEKGYGPYRPELVQRAPKKRLGDPRQLKPGNQIGLQTRAGPRMATIRKVGLSVVDLDFNHPLAGQHLRFAIEVVDVREGNAEEIAHGHAHGPGGHQHEAPSEGGVE
jgi:FKBP-type peptidyl-prolyl cis-trans isomerase SlyD